MALNGLSASDLKTADPDRRTELLTRALRHHRAGRFDEALTLIDSMIDQFGPLPKLRHYKGLVLVSLGKREEGEDLIRAALKDAPDDPVHITDLGTILAEQGRLDEAVSLFREAVEKAPNYAVARSNLGGALVLERKFGEAITHLKQAVRLEPTMIDGFINLSQAMLRGRRESEAVDTLFRALAIDPNSIAAHLALADALFRLERHEAAEHHARRALELNPGVLEAYLRLADILGAMGRMDEAAESCLKAASGRQLAIPAVSKLIHLRKTQAESPEFHLLQQMLGQADKVPERPQSTLHMAAGKAFEDLGRFAEAFDHYRQGNELTKTFVSFDPAAHCERAERLREFCSPALMKRCSSTVVSEVKPIFIVGMPRSGTTLMDQMFSRHSNVQAGGEQRSMMIALSKAGSIQDALEKKTEPDELNADDFANLGEAYLAAARENGLHGEVFTDKMPSNYLYAAMAALALPRARVIFMRRHPFDCLLSNYAQNFGENQPASTDLSYLATTYKEFDAMARHTLPLLPDRAIEIHYEDVVADAEGTMRKVMAFCNLDWEDAILDHTGSSRPVNTASVAQVRQSIYTTSVAKWARYAPYLGPLAEELKDYIPEADYRIVQEATQGEV